MSSCLPTWLSLWCHDAQVLVASLGEGVGLCGVLTCQGDLWLEVMGGPAGDGALMPAGVTLTGGQPSCCRHLLAVGAVLGFFFFLKI